MSAFPVCMEVTASSLSLATGMSVTVPWATSARTVRVSTSF